MRGKKLGHFKHGDLVLAEEGSKFGISIDIAFVCSILQVIVFNVLPNLLGNFSTRHSLIANNRSQFS